MLFKNLFRKKSATAAIGDGEDIHGHGLHKVLTVRDLTFFGIAAIIGGGTFSAIGNACHSGGPAVILLYIICAVACGFTAMCYAEFASRVPVSGSAYTYAYVSFGELFAWIIGWALLMEYSIGNIYIAFSWSGYFTNLLELAHIHLPQWLTINYSESIKAFIDEAPKALAKGAQHSEGFLAWVTAPKIGKLHIIFDLPAVVINALITVLVYMGTKESRNFSNIMVVIKLLIIAAVVLVGVFYIDINNWHPFMPHGFGGVMGAVSGVFFAYIGFDAVSTLAEESKNPQRDLPRGMIYSLIICTVVFIILCLVLTGMASYNDLGVSDPLAVIFKLKGVKWMLFIVSIGAVVAMTSVLLVFQMGQPRIWMSMSRDGLLPKQFGKIHPKYKTPGFSTIITGLVVGIPIFFTNENFVLDFTSIGTLFAFVLVCGGVLMLPMREAKVAGETRRFRLPYINGKLILLPLFVITIISLYFGLPKEGTYLKRNSTIVYVAVPELNKLVKTGDSLYTIKSGTNYCAWKDSISKDSSFVKSVNDTTGYKLISDYPGYFPNLIKITPATASTKIPMIIFLIVFGIISVVTIFKNFSLIPLLGLLSCCYLLTGMTLNNWAWFSSWLAIGLIVYFCYGYRKSKLAKQ